MSESTVVGVEMDLPAKQGLYDPRNEHDACGVGFVANIKGARSHEIIGLGLQLLINLDHRGAVGADPLVGDGAGILIQIPDPLFRDWAKETGVTLPPPGQYAVAMCFLPREAKAREIVVKQFEHFIKVEGQKLLGWRDVPTDPTGLGKTVLSEMPLIRQAIVAMGPHTTDQDSFERKLLHGCEHFSHEFRIKCARRFIEEHQCRVHHQRPGDGNSLLLPPRKLTGIFLSLRRESHTFQDPFARLDGLFGAHTSNHRGCDGQVLHHRQVGKQVELLKDHADIRSLFCDATRMKFAQGRTFT